MPGSRVRVPPFPPIKTITCTKRVQPHQLRCSGRAACARFEPFGTDDALSVLLFSVASRIHAQRYSEGNVITAPQARANSMASRRWPSREVNTDPRRCRRSYSRSPSLRFSISLSTIFSGSVPTVSHGERAGVATDSVRRADQAQDKRRKFLGAASL